MKIDPRVVWKPCGEGRACYAPIRDPLNTWEFEGVIGLPVLRPAGRGRGKDHKRPFVILTLAHMPIFATATERKGRYPVVRAIFKARDEVAEVLGELQQGTYLIVRGRFDGAPKSPPLITEFEIVEDPESRARNLGTEDFLDVALGS